VSTLVEATLDRAERRALERITAALGEDLGDELLAIWLFGSRARGEWPGPESDVDLLVLIERAGWHDRDRVREIVDAALAPEGVNRFDFSVHVGDPAWLAERRAMGAFFIQEVDRDKVVLAGSGGEEWQASSPVDVESARIRRSEELLDVARQKLADARTVLPTGPSSAVSLAYYSMLNAARAALSAEDHFARTHRGTWHQFREVFVVTGRIEESVVSRAEATQRKREDADYEAWVAEPEEAATVIRDAERLLELVTRLA